MLTLASKLAAIYTASRQLISGDDFNNLASQLNSSETGIIAKAGGGQASAYQLKAAVNIVSTVATAADSVKLPKGLPGLSIWIQNADGSDSMQVFTQNTGTINNTNGVTTGVAQAASVTTATMYKCIAVNPTTGAETWITK